MLRRFSGPMAALIVFLMAMPAQAYVITTSVGTYDVTAILGNWASIGDTLDDQVWWNNAALADEFASMENSNLGTPNAGSAVFFAYSVSSLFISHYRDWAFSSPSDISAFRSFRPKTDNWYYAVATEVTSLPEPGTLGLLIAGFVGVALSRRRKAR